MAIDKIEKPRIRLFWGNGARVPTISQFFGITIRMYYREHQPAHFHAYYAESSAVVAIETLAGNR